MVKLQKEKVYELALDIAKTVARRKHSGTLIVIGPRDKFKGTYRRLYPQLLRRHYINEKGIKPVLNVLASLDGAILISDEGEIIAYGAMLRKIKTFKGFGTKHAAASGITNYIKRSTALLVSERIDWIKVFKGGKVVVEMDSAERSNKIQKDLINFLTDNDTALLTAAGVSAAIVGFYPALILSGTYLVAKTAGGIIKKNLKSI